jgi:hypothetical protein
MKYAGRNETKSRQPNRTKTPTKKVSRFDAESIRTGANILDLGSTLGQMPILNSRRSETAGDEKRLISLRRFWRTRPGGNKTMSETYILTQLVKVLRYRIGKITKCIEVRIRSEREAIRNGPKKAKFGDTYLNALPLGNKIGTGHS